MLFEDVLGVARLGLLGPGVDADAVEEALTRAKFLPAQDAADLAGRVLTQTEWKTSPIPPVSVGPGAYWLEWRLPERMHPDCGGALLGALVEIEKEGRGVRRIRGLCFMFKTPLIRFSFTVDTAGKAREEDSTSLLVRYMRDGADQEPRDSSTFAWVFLAPVLLALSPATAKYLLGRTSEDSPREWGSAPIVRPTSSAPSTSPVLVTR